MNGQLQDPAALPLDKELLYLRASTADESHWGELACIVRSDEG
jgi:hypothetical protein